MAPAILSDTNQKQGAGHEESRIPEQVSMEERLAEACACMNPPIGLAVSTASCGSILVNWADRPLWERGPYDCQAEVNSDHTEMTVTAPGVKPFTYRLSGKGRESDTLKMLAAIIRVRHERMGVCPTQAQRDAWSLAGLGDWMSPEEEDEENLELAATY